MGKFYLSYKRIENVYNSTSKKSKRSFFKEAAKHGTIISRKYINTEQELVKLFNEHYTNIRRNSSGKNVYH